ncbi:hypothetical protein QFZ75_007994 [Streptomyces sp. V3I8]|uniref:hypothetical protein n=1 Tax=Streptomyces sp. V3I8 TaxID=3042279 RepID=UPI002781B39A|nr:hypothetical protein [Streptomyces sp. V3I8]MDQ1041492.1 hypothetical protein [Streptomyces sp. V3I8]
MDAPTQASIEILKSFTQSAQEHAETASNRTLSDDTRRDAAQAADSTWRGIMTVARHLAELCEQEGAALESQILALDPDDFSRDVMELDARSRVWSDLSREMDALATAAVGKCKNEERLGAETADL